MKKIVNKWVYIAYAAAWIATSAAIIAAIFITEKASPLWFLIVPTLLSIRSNSKDE